MIVIGFDPGSRFTGYGILEKNNYNFNYIDSGIINLTKELAIEKKLVKLYESIKKILTKYKPTSAAIEDIFVAKNIKGTLKLGYVKGTIFLVCGHNGIDITEYSATKVKQSITGKGRATKEEITLMLSKLIVNIPKKFQYSDESDAIAIAYCHLLELDFLKRI